MNKLKYYALSSACFTLALAGCSNDDFMSNGSGEGTISLRADVNTAVLTSRSRAFADNGVVTVEDLKVRLKSEDGTYNRQWNSVYEFGGESRVPVGNYTIEAFFGDANTQGFDCPYYYGSQLITVKQDQVTETGVTATLANTMFTVAYSDAVKSYLSDYSVELQGEGSPVTYAKDETRPAYMKAGSVEVWVNVKKQNGVTGKLLAATVTAEARHHYLVNVDLSNQTGTSSLVVTFDESLVTEECEIDLSDELLQAPAPLILTEGFDANGVAKAIGGSPMHASARYVVIARGKLAHATLTTDNTSLFTSAWPGSIDLVAASDAEVNALKALGLDVRGFRGTVDQMAYIDFKNIAKYIKLPASSNEATITFTLNVLDAQAKTCDPVTVKVKVSELIKASIVEEDVWAKQADITYTAVVNGQNVASQIKAAVSTDGVTFTAATASILANGKLRVSSLQPATHYFVALSLPASVDPDGFTAVVEFTTEAATQLPNAGMEEWSIGNSGNNWQTYFAAASTTAAVWGTNNPMTTSQGANYAYCRISGTVPTTDAHSGTNAALLRTIGWGSGNTASGITSTGVMKYADPGLLHLGSSRSERPSGYGDRQGPLTTDDLTCGYAFASRPASVSFWYKYTVKNSSDKGYAEVQVLAADGSVIASTTTDLSAASSYTQKTLTLNYPAGAKKAAKVYVKFLSTNNRSFLDKTNDNFTPPPFANLSDGKYLGSQLYIDDINLNY